MIEKTTAMRLCDHSAHTTAITRRNSPKLGGYRNKFEKGICESKMSVQ